MNGIKYQIQKISLSLRRFPFLVPSIVYTVFFTYAQIERFRSFNANAYDLSFITQSLWNTIHGNGFLRTMIRGNPSYLGEHFSPIIAILSPLFLLPHPECFLFAAQALLICSGTYFLWALGNRLSYSRNLTLLAIGLYFLYAPIWMSNFFDFREDLFFIPCLFGLILIKERKSYGLFWPLVALTLMVKENASIPLFFVGAWLMFDGEKKRGIFLSVFSAVFFLILNGFVMRHFAGEHTTTLAVNKLAMLGSSGSEVLKSLLYSPMKSVSLILANMFNKQGFEYIARIFVPFAPLLFFVKRKGAWPLAIAVFLVLFNLLINLSHAIGFHYELILVPFLFAFLVYTLPDLSARLSKKATVVALVLCSVVSFRVSPFRVLHDNRIRSEHLRLSKILDQIPDDVSVSTQTALHPHLCYRKVARIFSQASNLREDYVVLSTLPGLDLFAQPNLESEMSKVSSNGYRLLVDQPEAKVWCRSDICPQ